MKNNFIVFIHSYSELDMILPFIDYVLTKHNDQVTLYTDNRNIQDAAYYHLEYLKTYHKIKPKYFFEEQFFVKYRYILLLHDNIKQFRKKRKKEKNIRYIGYMISIISLIMTRVAEYTLEKPIKEYVDTLNISDRIMMYCSGEVKFPCRAIVNYAEKRDIKTIGYFQGFYLYSNLKITGKAVTVKRSIRKVISDYIKTGKRQYCNYYLVGKSMKNTFFRSVASIGFNKMDRIVETVTPRYTKGWTKIFRAYLMKNEKINY
ncbi:MAG: hypothetical protein QF864_07805, partial [SAR202 cluster bacterium]|nr:hypothetical protein [SAR202 cluster bacterium]